MIEGTLGIIGCPILEDEIIHFLTGVPDEKTVYLVDTPHTVSLKRKMEKTGVPFITVSELDFDGDRTGSGAGFNIVIVMNNLALHKDPKDLRRTLEDQLLQYQDRFDAIALYYGMCGNAGWDVSAWASSSLNVPVFVFRDRKGEVCDDCIGVAVGGRSEYYDLVKRYTGMFFVTPAIAENWDAFSDRLDFTKGFEVMGITTVKEVFEMYGYKNAVRIDTGLGICGEELDRRCERFSEITGLKFVATDPGITDMYPTERLYKDIMDSMKG
jgi:hypothetical protein